MSTSRSPGRRVVRTAAEWQALWKQHDGTVRRPPSISRSHCGRRVPRFAPTAGFAAEITAVKTEGTRTVEYLERQPPRDEFVAQVLTSPFHIVRIARTAGSVEFRRLTQ